MAKQFGACLQHYQLPDFEPRWGAIRRGIEKESLRVVADGHIALSPHPRALGSALTNPFITTDFSEALLEFITPAFEDIGECLKVLEDIHRFTVHNLEPGEILWAASMPCPFKGESGIPIARYGSSNIGRLKTLYRQGLRHRYGSLMQIISGLHYNFSMPDSFWEPWRAISGSDDSLQDFRTSAYLRLIRNFHRWSWLLIYLFGASPAACRCFVDGRDHGLREFDGSSLYLPNATCLRMGRLGYQSAAQKSLFVSYNDLDAYVDCLYRGMHTGYPDYQAIGQSRDGEYLQINTSLLQLENEFYSTIRPKRNTLSGERPLAALTARGIEYVEVRALDLNPFTPLGIDARQVRFLDTFLLHCLLSDSPLCDEKEFFEIAGNIARVVEDGRDPGLRLQQNAVARPLREWARELLDGLGYAAGILDHVHGGEHFEASLVEQARKVEQPGLTPSGRIIQEMREHGLSFFDLAMAQSRTHDAFFRRERLDPASQSRLRETSTRSLQEQQRIEAADSIDFDEFLRNWNAP